MNKILPWTSALTASLSAESKKKNASTGSFPVDVFLYGEMLDDKQNSGYDGKYFTVCTYLFHNLSLEYSYADQRRLPYGELGNEPRI
jgi:hypothetical protein